MDLYIIRHAWAGQYGDPQWPDDSQRPLTKKGRKRFAAMVNILKRARHGTFAYRHKSDGSLPGNRENSWRKPDRPTGNNRPRRTSSSRRLGKPVGLDRPNKPSNIQQIAWVGHAPDVEHHYRRAYRPANASIRFAKGAVADVRFNDPIEIGGGELRWLVTAKLLDC